MFKSYYLCIFDHNLLLSCIHHLLKKCSFELNFHNQLLKPTSSVVRIFSFSGLKIFFGTLMVPKYDLYNVKKLISTQCPTLIKSAVPQFCRVIEIRLGGRPVKVQATSTSTQVTDGTVRPVDGGVEMDCKRLVIVTKIRRRGLIAEQWAALCLRACDEMKASLIHERYRATDAAVIRPLLYALPRKLRLH